LNYNPKRVGRIIDLCIQDFELNLEDLVVFTEAATGAYLYAPILTALAGARKVYALAGDSRFGSIADVRKLTLEAAKHWNVEDRIEILEAKSEEFVSESDIFTNSGFVRPIDAKMISWMKPTAVVPLMWETWEYREGDLDLACCRENNILVLGTDESKPPINMFPYVGFMAMKLLFEMGLEGFKTSTLLLGGGGLGRYIRDHFVSLEMEISWFADNEAGSQPFESLSSHFEEFGQDHDMLLVAEHQDNRSLVGSDGLLPIDLIKFKNPAIQIGCIAGNIRIEELQNSGLEYFPKELRPFGYMSYQPYNLGPKPVLELFSAGLKVGEVMARGRLSGMSVLEATRFALDNSPAMDF
jgi:hypothetical protein